MSAKFAVISDVHSNLLALEAVLRQVEEDGLDAVYCLGDVVGYGAEPNECVEEVRRVADGRAIRGNHDVATLRQFENYEEWFNPDAKAAIRYQRERLNSENMEWLAGLPENLREREYRFYHGSPLGTNHYLLSISDLKAALDQLGDDVQFRILFTGHTHVPIVVAIGPDRSMIPIIEMEGQDPSDQVIRLEDGIRYMINPGSVGQPRDRVHDAAYAIIDMESGVVRLRRAKYDVREAMRRILAAGLPDFLAYRLEYGM